MTIFLLVRRNIKCRHRYEKCNHTSGEEPGNDMPNQCMDDGKYSLSSTPSCSPAVCDDVVKWKGFLHYWPFARGIHRSPTDSPHKGTVMWNFDVFVVVRLNIVAQTVEMPVIRDALTLMWRDDSMYIPTRYVLFFQHGVNIKWMSQLIAYPSPNCNG